MVKTGNLARDLPGRPLPDEVVDLLVERPGLRIERIESTGQTTPKANGTNRRPTSGFLSLPAQRGCASRAR